jgi:serine carboxypeptidase 1
MLAKLVLFTAPWLAAAAIPDSSYAYVTPRSGAHMFYWLYGCSAPDKNCPLVIWLQGGPGAGSSGYGNFAETGPLDTNLQPRNTTWVQSAHMLYVDNPVGSGFSYVDNAALLTTNLTQIANDFVVFMRQILNTFPDLQTTPTYIFSESYGGKMAVGIAAAMLAAIDQSTLPLHAFKGIALGDSWISGLDYVQAWGPWLRQLSVMDAYQLSSQVQPSVQQCAQAVAQGQWADATNAWGDVEDDVEATTDGVSFYNVLQHNTDDELARRRALRQGSGFSAAAAALLPAGVSAEAARKLFARHVGPRLYGQDLDTLMNGAIRQQLGIVPPNVTWGGQSDAVFAAQSVDFMRDVVGQVDALLADGRLSITVYNGQLDLICCTSGTEAWMERLTWGGMQSFQQAAKTPLYSWPGTTETGGFVKRYKQLAMYYIMDAGHMLPGDNGDMALKMMRMVTGQEQA